MITAKVGEAFVQVRIPLEDLDVDLKKTNQKIVKSMEKVGRDLDRIGKDLSLKITAPIVALGVASSKMSAEFESSMQKIVGLVGIAKTEVDAWNDSLLAMAPAVARGPVELADALFFITSAGLRGEAALDALNRSARASSAGLGLTKDVALAVVSAVNTWGKSGLDAAAATDVLVKTVREGNLEASELATSLGQVLGIAEAAGASFADVGGAIAVMTRQGLNSARAVTSLQQVFTLLLRATPQSEEALGKVGLTLGDLRKTLKEQGLLALLRTLDKAFDGNLESLSEVIPSVEALRSALSILGQDTETVNGVFDSVKNATGALDGAFSAASDTVEFKYNQALANSQSSMIRLGDTLKPFTTEILSAFNEGVGTLADSFQNLNDDTKETGVKIAAVTAAIGPALIALGSLIRVVKFAAIGLTALATPVGAIAAGLTALGGLALKEFIRRSALTELEEAEEQLGRLLRQQEMFGDRIPPAAKKRIEELTTKIKELKEASEDATEQTDELGIATAAIAAIISGMGEEASKAGEATGEVFNSLTLDLLESRDAVQDLVDSFDKFGVTTTANQDLLEMMGYSLDNLNKDLEGFRQQQQNIMDSTDEASQKAQDLGLTFSSAFEDAIVEGKGLRAVLEGIWKDILRIAVRKSVTEPIGNWLGGLFSSKFGGFFADGGSPPVGVPSIVGERGPELFIPNTSGTIVPNEAMGGMGGINQTFNFPLAFPPQLESFIRGIAGPTARAAALQVMNSGRGRI